MNDIYAKPVEFTIGMDVGGTKIATGLVSRDGTIQYEVRRPTREDPCQIIQDMAACIHEVWDATGAHGSPIGVGVPGLVTSEGILRYGPNISIVEMDIKKLLQAKFPDSTIHVDNDANVAAWAEYCIGAAKSPAIRNVVMYTLGTGIGGAIIVNGSLVRGSNGFAGEIGHVILERGGRAGPSQIPGEIEAYSSGTAIGEIAKQKLVRGELRNSTLGCLTADEISGVEVSQAAMQGDVYAQAILHEIGESLGVASAGMVNTLDPDLIVVGGGAASAAEFILGPMQEMQNQYTLGAPDYRDFVPVVHSQFTENSGIVGAGLLAFKTCGANLLL